MTSRNSYPWRKVCDFVVQESDPVKAFPLYERARSALELHLAQLGGVPATKAEQKSRLFFSICDVRHCGSSDLFHILKDFPPAKTHL
jgi:hypothetical protein